MAFARPSEVGVPGSRLRRHDEHRPEHPSPRCHVPQMAHLELGSSGSNPDPALLSQGRHSNALCLRVPCVQTGYCLTHKITLGTR